MTDPDRAGGSDEELLKALTGANDSDNAETLGMQDVVDQLRTTGGFHIPQELQQWCLGKSKDPEVEAAQDNIDLDSLFEEGSDEADEQPETDALPEQATDKSPQHPKPVSETYTAVNSRSSSISSTGGPPSQLATSMNNELVHNVAHESLDVHVTTAGDYPGDIPAAVEQGSQAAQSDPVGGYEDLLLPELDDDFENLGSMPLMDPIGPMSEASQAFAAGLGPSVDDANEDNDWRRWVDYDGGDLVAHDNTAEQENLEKDHFSDIGDVVGDHAPPADNSAFNPDLTGTPSKPQEGLRRTTSSTSTFGQDNGYRTPTEKVDEGPYFDPAATGQGFVGQVGLNSAPVNFSMANAFTNLVEQSASTPAPQQGGVDPNLGFDGSTFLGEASGFGHGLDEYDDADAVGEEVAVEEEVPQAPVIAFDEFGNTIHRREEPVQPAPQPRMFGSNAPPITRAPSIAPPASIPVAGPPQQSSLPQGPPPIGPNFNAYAHQAFNHQFASLDEALAHKDRHLNTEHRFDPTVPVTDAENMAVVERLYWAVVNIEGTNDYPPKLADVSAKFPMAYSLFAQPKRDLSVEIQVACWEVLERCKVRHSSRSLVPDWQRGGGKKAEQWPSFASLIDRVVEALMRQKTMAKRLLDASFLDDLIDGPATSLKRSVQNKHLNDGKKLDIEVGKRARRAGSQAAGGSHSRQGTAVLPSVETATTNTFVPAAATPLAGAVPAVNTPRSRSTFSDMVPSVAGSPQQSHQQRMGLGGHGQMQAGMNMGQQGHLQQHTPGPTRQQVERNRAIARERHQRHAAARNAYFSQQTPHSQYQQQRQSSAPQAAQMSRDTSSYHPRQRPSSAPYPSQAPTYGSSYHAQPGQVEQLHHTVQQPGFSQQASPQPAAAQSYRAPADAGTKRKAATQDDAELNSTSGIPATSSTTPSKRRKTKITEDKTQVAQYDDPATAVSQPTPSAQDGSGELDSDELRLINLLRQETHRDAPQAVQSNPAHEGLPHNPCRSTIGQANGQWVDPLNKYGHSTPAPFFYHYLPTDEAERAKQIDPASDKDFARYLMQPSQWDKTIEFGHGDEGLYIRNSCVYDREGKIVAPCYWKWGCLKPLGKWLELAGEAEGATHYWEKIVEWHNSL